jgi:hypothetical protein
MIRLRYNFGVDIDRESTQILMKFLAQTMRNEELLRALLTRVNLDKENPLSSVECLCISRMLTHSFSLNPLIHFTPPLFLNRNYLNIFPPNLELVSCLSIDSYLTSSNAWLT